MSTSGHGMASPGLAIDWARRYDVMTAGVFGAWQRSAFRAVVTASGARPGERVLDVGCGPGRLSRRMADAVGPQGSVVGVDLSDAMVERARRNNAGVPQVRFQQGIAQELPLDDGSVDVVVSSLMLHHLPDDGQQAAAQEMYRVLRPGGRLVIAEFEPPRGRVGRRLLGLALAGMNLVAGRHGHGHDHDHGEHPMAGTSVQRTERPVLAAGFTEVRHAFVRPLMHLVVGTKPV